MAAVSGLMLTTMATTGYVTVAMGRLQRAIDDAAIAQAPQSDRKAVRRCAFVEGMAYESAANGFSVFSIFAETSASDRANLYVKTCASRMRLKNPLATQQPTQ